MILNLNKRIRYQFNVFIIIVFIAVIGETRHLHLTGPLSTLKSHFIPIFTQTKWFFFVFCLILTFIYFVN